MFEKSSPPTARELHESVKTPTSTTKAKNALTYNVAENLSKEMFQWYSNRMDEDDHDMHIMFQHLRLLIFRKVKVTDDIWPLNLKDLQPTLDASQLNDYPREQSMVVSKEYTACIRETLKTREKWLGHNDG